MRYISTRGQAPALAFDDVLLAGLASDGGLYLPESWPEFSAADLRALRGKSWQQVAVEVMAPFTAPVIDRTMLSDLVSSATAGFGHAGITPLVQSGPNDWLLELFHGPTLAFKDVALQFLGQLFDHVLAARGQSVTIIGATSGDTGSAAIEACRDRDNIRIFILHPHGRTSDVQRRQMTTVLSPNVCNIALEGTFDDCQDAVKAMFADAALREEAGLSAVNSINWARIMAQVVYYVVAALALGAPDRAVSFAVPTGNFGNIFAAWVARQMGVPIRQLVVGTNSNDILARFFATGEMRIAGVQPTISPSMDIQISSNFERLLFELSGRDDAVVREAMRAFRSDGAYRMDAAALDQARGLFSAARVDEADTLATIADIHRTTGMLIDPHTAVGVAAARVCRLDDEPAPMIQLACAHPAKFPDPVKQATGHHPALPEALKDLFERKERFIVLKNDLDAIKACIRNGGKAV